MKDYLSIAIDHGTSYSSIAVMESGGPRVIKTNGVDEIMPSVVYMDQRGRTIVGGPAYRAMLTNKVYEGDGYTGYKLRIGQGDRYEFAAAKKALTAPQLGGLVIGALLKAYQEESGEYPQAAVITMPAKFEHSAVEGTREAARLAGLRYYPLLQEPIAAALAYGFTAADRRAQWMVFDLGGGTLDISLVIVRDGQMVVPEEGHAGDNRLGGCKFDREILDYALTALRKQHALDGFSENNKDYRRAWGRLLIACEQARIDLSYREDAKIEVMDTLCKDRNGKDVRVMIPINRSQYEKMIAADVEKAVHLCRTLLTQNHLAARDLTRLILLGESTRMPYLRSSLANGLGVEIGMQIDPTTTVAIGAAIHAATIPMPEALRTSMPGAKLDPPARITLMYDRVPKTPTCAVVGRVEAKSLELRLLQIEIRREDGWSTGQLPVGSDGFFETEVKLLDEGKPQCSKFTTQVLDAGGEVLASVSEPEVWYPLPEGHARLANSLLIALPGNGTARWVRKGAELPVSEKLQFAVLKPVRRGSRENVLEIDVLEGITDLFDHENERADLNFRIGQLIITGDEIECDLPEGAKIDITLNVDESREVRCLAYAPLLDQQFEGHIKSEPFNVSLDDIVAKYEAVKASLDAAEKLQAELPLAALNDKFQTIQRLDVMNEITKEIDRAKQGEKDAFNRSYRRILELQGALCQIHQEQTDPRVRRQMRRLKSVAAVAEQRTLHDMESEFEAALKANDRAALQRIEGQLECIERALTTVIPQCLDARFFHAEPRQAMEISAGGAPLQIMLDYERAPRSFPCLISGSVQGPAISARSARVELRRKDGTWHSQRAPIAPDGTFVVRLSLNENEPAGVVGFTTHVVDETGRAIASFEGPWIWNLWLNEFRQTLPQST